MAEITFQTNMAQNSTPPTNSYTLSGSGLGFFGTTAGSSVQIGSYQDTTYISNADGRTLYIVKDNKLYFEILQNESLKIFQGGTSQLRLQTHRLFPFHFSPISLISYQ